MATEKHDHRSFNEETWPRATCECGELFEDDAAWRKHWEEIGTPIEEIMRRARERDDEQEPAPFSEENA